MSPANLATRAAARRGFTLTELMVVTTLIGVMAAMSVPSFTRAVQQSRVDISVANLRAIWAAERLYWLENHTYTPVTAPTTPDQALQSLQNLGLLDAEVLSGVGGYNYSVTSGTTTTFTAQATSINTWGLGCLTIDQTGSVDSTNSKLTPSFQ